MMMLKLAVMLSTIVSSLPVHAMHHNKKPPDAKDLQPVIGGQMTLKNLTEVHVYAQRNSSISENTLLGDGATRINETLQQSQHGVDWVATKPQPITKSQDKSRVQNVSLESSQRLQLISFSRGQHGVEWVFSRRCWVYLAAAAQVLCLAVAFLLIVYFGSSGISEYKAVMQPTRKNIDHPEEFFKMGLTELITMLGIPAFCILPFSVRGTSGLPTRISVMLLAAQSYFVQLLILHYLVIGVWDGRGQQSLPTLAIAAAIYLNILGHMSELPVGLLLLKHIYQFHELRIDRVIAYSIFIMSMLIIPCASMIIASMYLAESPNFIDLITKSIVFKFIGMIDTWIVAINSRANLLAGAVEPMTVHIPVDKKFANVLNHIFCIVPIAPIGIVVLITYFISTMRMDWTGVAA